MNRLFPFAFVLTAACHRHTDEPETAPSFLDNVEDAQREGCYTPEEAGALLNVARYGSVLRGQMDGCGDADVQMTAYAYCEGGDVYVQLTPDSGKFCGVDTDEYLTFGEVCVSEDEQGTFLSAVLESDMGVLGLVERLVPGDTLGVDKAYVYELTEANAPVRPDVWPGFRIDEFKATGTAFAQDRRHGVDTDVCGD